MAYNPTGWEALGYGLAGGFEKDRKALQAQEASKTAYQAAKTGKVTQNTEQLKIQNQMLHKQMVMLQNQMAAKDLDQATDSLITNGNYEEFNSIIKNNLTLAQKFANNYRVKSIRPIDWNNKQDIAEVIKAGVDPEVLSQLSDEDKKEGIGRSFYMTDAGHLTSLDEFVNQTGYINKMTSDKFNAYLGIRNKLANIGKKLTTDEVKAKDFLEWHKKTGGSYSEYEQIGKQAKESKGQYQKQIETFDRNNPNATKEERDAYIKGVMEKSIYGVAQTRKDKGVSDLTNNQLKAIDLVDSGKYERKDLLKLENSIMSDLDSNVKTQVKDDLKSMKANHKMVVSIDRLLKEADEGRVKVDKDTVANFTTYVSKIFGKDTPQALKNVDFNTAGGLLLAGFMKDMSGATVSDVEARRLLNIFQGGDLADETFVKQAMKKFASESKEYNKILAENNKHYAPDSVVRFTTYRETKKPEVQQKDTSEVATQKEPVINDAYQRKYEKYKSLIGQVNPKTGKKLVGFEKEAPFNPIYEEVK